MSHLNTLDAFLKASEEAFCDGSLVKIESLLSDKFTFEMHFECRGQKWRSAGGKTEFLKTYRGLFASGQTFSNWRYTVLECRQTLLGKVKATLLFSCVAHTPNAPDRDERHIETIECEPVPNGLRLLRLNASAGELSGSE